MTILVGVICFLIGCGIGRLYGWMKYHYPEFQEAIKLKTAKLRAERARAEAQEERYRGEIDDEIERRKRVSHDHAISP